MARSRRSGRALADLSRLCAELSLCRDLLEQPPPPVFRRGKGRMARCSGPISTCCSGCRCCLSPPPGPATRHFATIPVALYGCVLLAAAIAYSILVDHAVAGAEGETAAASRHRQRLQGQDFDCALCVRHRRRLLAAHGSAACSMCGVAAMWLVPDRRIEREIWMRSSSPPAASRPAPAPPKPVATRRVRPGSRRTAGPSAPW